MTGLINAALGFLGALSIILGASAYFFPREGHNASIVSLIAGGVFGLLILSSLAWWKKNPRAGRIFASVMCLAGMGNFIPKALKGGFYPNGLMGGLCLVVFILLAAGHLMAKREAKQ